VTITDRRVDRRVPGVADVPGEEDDPTLVAPVQPAPPALDDAGEVYRSLAPAVLGYLRGQGVRDPEDVLGDVFLNVARDLHRFSGDGDAQRRWVFTIAHHRLVDHRRRVRVRPVESDHEVPDLPGPAPVLDDLDPELLAGLRELTDQQRAVVLLRFVADLSLVEVAELTGRPVGAVKSMQARALSRLADRLAGDSGHEARWASD
jgi:RNA polymerase sigma factor (sigma-70 family)